VQKKSSKKLFTTGIAGLVVTAVCCFTPFLVIVFGAVGLSAMLGYLDYVLLPLLFCFLLLTIYAVMQRKKCDDQCLPAKHKGKSSSEEY